VSLSPSATSRRGHFDAPPYHKANKKQKVFFALFRPIFAPESAIAFRQFPFCAFCVSQPRQPTKIRVIPKRSEASAVCDPPSHQAAHSKRRFSNLSCTNTHATKAGTTPQPSWRGSIFGRAGLQPRRNNAFRQFPLARFLRKPSCSPSTFPRAAPQFAYWFTSFVCWIDP
jgi:hypothetical protein